MNYLKTAHRILRLCLTLVVGALSLLTIVGCGIFSEEPVSAPTATPRAIAPAATTPTQAPTEEAPGSVSIDTDFYRAVWTGDADTVRQLVDAGADVNAIDQDGNPFLQQAVWRDHVAVARVLIDAGADVNAKDSEDNPLLHEAIWWGHLEVAQVLIDAGADVNAKDTDGNPLLHEAIWRGHTEVARVLVDAGADVRCQRLRRRSAPVHRGLAGENGGSEDSHRCRGGRKRKKAQRGIAPVRGAMAGPYGNRADSPGSGRSGLTTFVNAESYSALEYNDGHRMSEARDA